MQHLTQPTVIKRGGFLSAIAHGFFGLLIVVVVSAATIGVYSLHIVDEKLDRVLGMGTSAAGSLPATLTELQKALPPALADALHDERAPEYRSQVDVKARLTDGLQPDQRQVVIEATNNGDRVITLMAVRVVLVDANDVPVSSIMTYAATPLTIDRDWRGPILPGSQRICSERLWRSEAGLTARLEIADIRVWTGSEAQPAEALAAADTASASQAD